MSEAAVVEPIAIIGMACRVPGARTLADFWHNMRHGVESITRFSREELLASGVNEQALGDPDYVPASGYLGGADRFDAEFFGLRPAEAEAMDPQHRLLCQTAWEAAENSGHDPARFGGAVGVFAGMFMNKYLAANLATNPRFQRSPMATVARIFNDKDFLATRVAHLLNLTGPAYTVQTACSTSLVATHLACQSLWSYESDVALVGGVAVNLPLKCGYPVAERGLFSPSGHCRPFDVHADGTVPGNGAVALVLRRYTDAVADRDNIYALIKGSAVNNDGAAKAGFTAPSIQGQATVITAALALAGVDPATIGYVEAHGTATQVGDPIEITALAQAYRSGAVRHQRCAIGSVKANIGHLDAAAGVAGLMRAALAIYHGTIPPNANFTRPNPELRLDQGPFYVPASDAAWQSAQGPRRAGVSSFGVGGTNAHVVLEQAPAVAAAGSAGSAPYAARQWQLLPVSGQSMSVAEATIQRLTAYLDQAGVGTSPGNEGSTRLADPGIALADVAFTLQDGRRAFGVRRFAVCSDVTDAARVLGGSEPQRLVTRTASASAASGSAVFAFPGGGMQHPDMGVDIYRSEPVFRAEVDQCADLLLPALGWDVRRLLFPSAFTPLPGKELAGGAATMGRDQGAEVVSALFVVEYALARLLMSWGIQPAAMIGHSLGEYVAACLAGVFSLSGALEITLARGELFAAMPPGRMLVVAMPEAQLAPMLPERISVSAVNAADLTVVAGPDADIAALLTELRADGIDCRKVSVPVASHSWMVEPYLDDFAAKVRRVTLAEPHMPFVSCVTGTWITADEATDPMYWVRHLREPVRFAAGVREVLTEPDRVLVEVGPGRALTALARAQRLAPTPTAIPTMGLPRDPLPDLAHLVTAAGRLWQAGVELDWAAFHGAASPRRVPLPTYPFAEQRYWVEAGRTALVATEPDPPPPSIASRAGAEPGSVTPWNGAGQADAPRTDLEREIAQVWCDLLGSDQVGIDDDFFDLGAHSLMVTQVTRELRRMGAPQLTARDVLQAPTIAQMAALVERARRGEATSMALIENVSPDEAVLDAEIRGDGRRAPDVTAPKTVLLTGATGFVGAFLCAELVRRTSARVLCLVRAPTEAEGLERVRAKLRGYGLPEAESARLSAVAGDLARPLFGWTAAGFDGLADQIDAIYHCGAWVNFVRPYRVLKATNVSGTEEILRLATRNRLIPVHHISTLAALAGAMISGSGTIREDDPLPPPAGHDTAYSQSKWVAERLVVIARERGIPVSVYRAGGVLADSSTGAANTEDYVTKVIQGCVQLGLAPLRDYALSVGTVDDLARQVVALSLRPEALGRTFHTIDPGPLAWNEIFDQIRRFGYPVRSVPFGQWRQTLTERVESEGDDNALAPLMAMLGDMPDRRMPQISTANVAAVLGGAPAEAPTLGTEYFARMLRFMTRRRLLPPVTTKSDEHDFASR
jgi:phthiocerol/phenolphthiocerol synthesis type-I polyketide synthase E